MALTCAVSLGFLIGTALGMNRFAGEVGEPVLVGIYSLPKITLYPIVLLAFGIGLPAKVAFGAMHGIVPIAIFTMGALRSVNPVYLKAARVQRMSRWQTVRLVLLPASVPEVFTGLRIGFSLTLIGTLLGEMFASQRGHRLPADAGDRAAQHPDDHRLDLHPGMRCRDGELDPIVDRPAAASPIVVEANPMNRTLIKSG